MSLRYSFSTALGGMWREKWINILCTITIGVGLFIVALGAFTLYNVDLAARKLPSKFSLVVYLKDDVSAIDRDALISRLKGLPSVSKVRYVSKEEALEDLKGSLSNADYIFEGLDGNPLPDAVDLKLKSEHVNPSAVEAISAEISKMEGVGEVQYGEKFLANMQKLMAGTRTIGLALLSALGLGMLFVCYSTVKILFYRKKDEVETLKLLGATKWFIRGPFLIEGGILGLAGGIIASIGAWSFYKFVFLMLAEVLPLLGALSLPDRAFALLPVAGLVIGVLGSTVALGRLRF